LRIAAAMAAAGRTSASRHAKADPTASAPSGHRDAGERGDPPNLRDDGREVDEHQYKKYQQQYVAEAAYRLFQACRKRGTNRPQRCPSISGRQLSHEHLAPDIERRDRETPGEDPVEDRHGRRHRDDGQYHDGDMERRREFAVASRIQRAPQRDGRAGGDRHEHDAHGNGSR
jgi:hypothetical protein